MTCDLMLEWLENAAVEGAMVTIKKRKGAIYINAGDSYGIGLTLPMAIKSAIKRDEQFGGRVSKTIANKLKSGDEPKL